MHWWEYLEGSIKCCSFLYRRNVSGKTPNSINGLRKIMFCYLHLKSEIIMNEKSFRALDMAEMMGSGSFG